VVRFVQILFVRLLRTLCGSIASEFVKVVKKELGVILTALKVLKKQEIKDRIILKGVIQCL